MSCQNYFLFFWGGGLVVLCSGLERLGAHLVGSYARVASVVLFIVIQRQADKVVQSQIIPDNVH